MSDHLKEVPPAAVLLGREVISVDAKSGEVQLRFLADRQFANRHGTVQGGMLAAMLDSATGNAVMTNLPSDRTAVTTRLDTIFVKPAALGPLTAIARLVEQDERSALAEAKLLDSSGQIVAHARAELRIRERRKGQRHQSDHIAGTAAHRKPSPRSRDGSGQRHSSTPLLHGRARNERPQKGIRLSFERAGVHNPSVVHHRRRMLRADSARDQVAN